MTSKPKVNRVKSVRGGGAPRADRDRYLTPPNHALAMCARLAGLIPTPARVVEPSAGAGVFVAASRRIWTSTEVMGVDIHEPNRAGCYRAGVTNFVHGDWVDGAVTAAVKGFRPDLIIGNPPFSLAEEHVKHALSVLLDGGHLALLLPVSFLCSRGRTKRLWSPQPIDNGNGIITTIPFGHLRYYMPLAERPSFTGNGKTDMTEYAVYVWKKGWDSWPQMVPHLWRADGAALVGEQSAAAFEAGWLMGRNAA